MATTPWWTDAQAQNPNPGGAGSDYTQVQNVPTADMSITPQYLAALQQLGYRGGMPNTPADYQAINQFLQQNGLTSATSYDNGGTQSSALVGPSGQPVAGTNRTYGSDPGDGLFLDAILGAATFGVGAAAGVGAGAAAGGADSGTAAGGAGLAGTNLPAYSAYTGAGSGASASLAGDATGTGILDGGAAAGSGLSSADTAALYGDAGYGAAASPSELAVGGAGAAGGAAGGTASGSGGLLGQIGDFATSKGGGALIGAGAGLLANGSGLNSATTTASKSIDPRIVPYVYGSDGTGGILGATANLYNQQMATGGLNANQSAGLNSQLGVLNDPNYATGFNQERALGSSLLNQGVAGNPFTGAQTAYGGAPMPAAAAAQVPGQPLQQRATTMPVYSGAPGRASGLLG